MNSPDLHPVERPTSSEPISLWERLLGQLGDGSFTVNMNAWPYLHYRSSVAVQPGMRDTSPHRP